MSIVCQEFTDAAAWDAFVRRATTPDEPLVSWAWCEFQRTIVPQTVRVAAMDGATVLGLGLFVPHTTRLGRSFILATRSPLIDPGLAPARQVDVWRALMDDAARRFRATSMFLKVEPNLGPPSEAGAEPGTEVHPARTLLLDLTKSDDALLSEMHQKTRYNIRLAVKKDVSARFGRNPQDIGDFLRLVHETASRQGIGVHPDAYYRTMVEALGSACEVGVATFRSEPLAAGIFYHFGDTVTYFHGGSTNREHERMAPYALQWSAIQRARARGARTFDFFGIAPDDAPKHRWAGVTRFKRGFGGTVKLYPGAFNVIYQRSWYLAYRLAKRIAGR